MTTSRAILASLSDGVAWTAQARAEFDSLWELRPGHATTVANRAQRIARTYGRDKVTMADWNAARLVAGDEFIPDEEGEQCESY